VEHLNQEQLDALVMGTAPLDDVAVRRHLATCATCARRLMLAAQLESDLYGAAEVVTALPAAHARITPLRMWRVALPLAAGLAAVAFATWTLIPRERPAGSPVKAARPAELSTSAHLPPQDVCRCVTAEISEGPPSDPGSSDLCTAGGNR